MIAQYQQSLKTLPGIHSYLGFGVNVYMHKILCLERERERERERKKKKKKK